MLATLWIGITLFQFALQLTSLGDFLWACMLALFGCMAASLGAQATLPQATTGSGSAPPPLLKGICVALLAAALASSVIGLAQWQDVVQGLFMYPSNGRVYGNLAQPNQFATLLVLALAALVYLDGQHLLRGVWLYAAAALLAFAVAASESRTGALSITLLALAIICSRSPVRTSLRWLLPTLALFWLCYAMWQPLSDWLGGSTTRTGVGLDSAGRFELWRQMVAAMEQQPWLGWGWLNLGAAQQAVADHLGGTANMDHAHNLFLDLLIWFGLPLGGLLTLLGLAWGLQTLTILFRPTSHRTAPTAIYCFLMLLPIGVHSMLEYPLAYLYFFVVFAFFAGALEASFGHARKLPVQAQRAASTLIIAGVVCAAWMTKEYLHIEADFRALRLEQEFDTKPQERHTYAPEPLLLTQYGAILHMLRISPSNPADTNTVESMRRSAARFPWLLTQQHYYLHLLSSNQCDAAARQRLVLKSFFGLFGLAKADEAAQRYQLTNRCELSH
jgi:O-antigen ligase